MSNARQTPYAILKWNTALCHCDAHKKKVSKHLENIDGVKINGKINIANGQGEVTMNISSTVDLHKFIKEFPIKENVKLFLKKPRNGESRQTPCVILKWNTAVCNCYSDQKKEVKNHLENIGGVEINGKINIANGQGEVTMNILSTVDLHKVIKEFPIKDEIRKNVELFLRGRKHGRRSRQTPCVILKWNTAVSNYDSKKKEVTKHLENIGGVKIDGEINIADGQGKVTMNIWNTIDLYKVIKEFPIKDEKTRKNVELFLKEN